MAWPRGSSYAHDRWQIWQGATHRGCPTLGHSQRTECHTTRSVSLSALELGISHNLAVMIVSYETLRNLTVELANCEVGLLICDEGHRLKNGESLTFTTLTSLKVSRRVILSGTPVQNDLSEYFSLLDFANPKYLGTKLEFRKNFENIIVRGRDADATDAVKQKSEEKLKELGGKVAPFIIRRTNELLSKYCKSRVDSSSIFRLTRYLCSAGQVRASRLLLALALPDCPLSTLHLLARDPKAASRQRITTAQSYRSAQEARQSSRFA